MEVLVPMILKAFAGKANNFKQMKIETLSKPRRGSPQMNIVII